MRYAQGKHNVLCFDFLSILQENRLHAVILPLKACHFGEEAHLAAQRNDFFPKLLYHAAQQIRPDMRLGIIKNFLGRALRPPFPPEPCGNGGL